MLTHESCAGADRSPPRPTAPWSSAPKPDDQRSASRLALEIPVAFRNGSGQHCAARLRNLSPGGLQVGCTVVTAAMIDSTGGKLHADNQPILHATVVLPLATGPETLSVGVRLLYCTRGPESTNCVMGFQFLDLRPKARRLIDAFFAEQYAPRYFDDPSPLEIQAGDWRAA